MSNNPYEQETGLVPKMVMGGILSAGAYASYKAYKNEFDDVKRMFGTALDHIAPTVNLKANSIQGAIESTYQHMRRGLGYGMLRRDATYKHSLAERDKVMSDIVEKSGGIKPVHLSDDVLKDLHSLPGGRNMTDISISGWQDIKNLQGDSIGHEVQSGLEKLLGRTLDGDAVEWSGTNLIVKGQNGAKGITVPFAKLDEATGAFVNRSGGTFKVAPWMQNYEAVEGGIKTDIVDWNTFLTKDILGGTKKDQLYHANDHAIGRNIHELDSLTNDKAKVTRKIIEDAIEGGRAVGSLDKEWKVGRLFKNLEANLQRVTGSSDAEIQKISRDVVPNRVSLLKLESQGYNGVSDVMFSLNTMSNPTNAEAANVASGSALESFYNLNTGMRANKKLVSVNGVGFDRYDKAPDPIKRKLIEVHQQIGFDKAQTPSAEGVSTTIGNIGYGHGVDSAKGRKEFYFAEDPANIPMRLNGNRDIVFDRNVRKMPLIWNPEAERHAPLTYGQVKNKGITNMYMMLDDKAEEVISVRKEMTPHMRGRRDHQFSVRGGVTGNGLPDETEIEYWLKGEAGPRKNTLAGFVESLEAREVTSSNFAGMKISAGSMIDFSEAESGLVKSGEDFQRLVTSKGSFTKTNFDIYMGPEHLAKTTRLEDGTILFSGEAEEAASKIGNAFSKTRTAYQEMTVKSAREMDKLSKETGMILNLDGSMSQDFFDKTIPSLLKSGALEGGKNRNEILTFLQESIAGHIGAYGKDVYVGGQRAEQLKKYLVDPSKFKGNLSTMEVGGHLQFNQNVGTMDEQLDLFTTIFGAIRKDIDKDKVVVDDAISYEEMSRFINGELNDYSNVKQTKPYVLKSGITMHEGKSAQGFGSNIYRMGVKDLPWTNPALMEELATSSLVDSAKIMSEGSLMMKSMYKDVRDVIKENNIPILDKDGIEDMLGGARGREAIENIKDPYVFKDTFMSNIKNKNGFAIRRDNGQLAYFGSGDFYGGGQYLPEDESLALQSLAMDDLRALNSAAATGTIPDAEYAAMVKRRAYAHASPKGGFKRSGAAQIEGSFYSKNIGSSELLNNAKFVDKVFNQGVYAATEEGREFANIFGNMALVDRDTAFADVRSKITDAEIVAKQEGWTRAQALRERFGDGHFLEKYMDGSKSAVDIANKVVNEAEGHGRKVSAMISEVLSAEGAGQTEKLREINRLVKENAMTGVLNRWPNVGYASRSQVYMFPTTQEFGDSSKRVAAGHLIRVNENADNDGDAIATLFTYSKNTRAEAHARIQNEQRISAEFMTMYKDRKLVGEIFDSAKKENFKYYFPINKAQRQAFAKSVDSVESSSSIAAALTKRLTGSANIKAMELKSAMMHQISKAKLTEHESRVAEIFAINMPGQSIEQRVISSKDERAITRNGQVTETIKAIIDNIGTVNRENFVKGMVSLQGDLGPLHMFTALKAASTKGASWMKEGSPDSILPEFRTLMNMNMRWRRSTEEETMGLAKLTGDYQESTWKAKWEAFNNRQQNNKFIEDISEINKAGFTHKDAFDQLEHLYSSPYALGGNSPDAAFVSARRELARLGAEGNEEDYLKLVSKHADSPHAMGSAGADAMVGNSLRSEEHALKSARRLKYFDEVKSMIGPMTPGKLAGAVGAAIVGVTALNLISGDGTPGNINDLPSVNNPSFEGPKYNQMSANRTIETSPNSDGSMGLLTDSRVSHMDTTSSISSLYAGRHYNTVSVRSDGTDPYKADMYTYSQ